MRPRRFWVTPGQRIFLSFEMTFSFIPKGSVTLELELDHIVSTKKIIKKIPVGLNHQFTIMREIVNFILPTPFSIGDLNSLGKITISDDDGQLYHDRIFGISVIPNTDYFEQIIVPKILSDMGFICEPIGGNDNPDIVANSQYVATNEKFDVECTLTSDYDSNRWYADTGKYRKYKDTWRIPKLLIVCNSNNITAGVYTELNKAKEPVGMIEYYDLVNLRDEFIKNGDNNKVYSMLSQTGKIVVGKKPLDFNWLLPKLFNVPITIGTN